MRYSYRSDDILAEPDHLWEFAWSAPMRELAERVGLSDVGLKKILRNLGVEAPPQGYWNKVKAGQAVPERPKAPDRRPGETGRLRLDARFAKVLTPSSPWPVDGPFATRFVPEYLAELLTMETKALGRISAPRDLQLAHPGLTQLLKREKQRREKHLASGYSWNKPTFDAPFSQRKLRLLNGLFLALAKRGHSGDAHEHEGNLAARAFVGDVGLRIVIDAVGKSRSSPGYYRQDHELPPATPLEIWIDPTFSAVSGETWKDDEDGKLETKLATITAGIIVAGEAKFRRGLREALERAEQQRQREEEARLARIAKLEAARLENLKLSGQLLREAQDIRALVQLTKAAVLAGSQALSGADLTEWETWALGYANRIDPIKSGQVLSHIRPLQGP